MMGSASAQTEEVSPQIVWRNPEPVQHRHRWELLRRLPGSAVYLVQELASAGAYISGAASQDWNCFAPGRNGMRQPVVSRPLVGRSFVYGL